MEYINNPKNYTLQKGQAYVISSTEPIMVYSDMGNGRFNYFESEEGCQKSIQAVDDIITIYPKNGTTLIEILPTNFI